MKLNPQESQYVSSYAKEAAVHGLPEQLLLRSQLFPGDYAFGAQSENKTDRPEPVSASTSFRVKWKQLIYFVFWTQEKRKHKTNLSLNWTLPIT